ncbi:hypothetical protein [Catenuloplanes indicus]|uniref:Ribosomally synthesized peptide with SipW-like signal peptide n=1 Tax=Catenuloplanes indicus TaxID=137267 RepID=A0AAE3W278_9ACTN|nr:hypothetical protein [Catenuloplanes indicus]MDQ0367985.1 hypothetical protein [Catenuloplanes indicus]
MSKSKKRGTTIAVAGAVAAVAIGGGVAWAAFTKDSSATAAGAGGKLKPLTTVSATTVYEGNQTALWPKHPADVRIVVSNPNEIDLVVKTVTLRAQNGIEATGATPDECETQIEAIATLPAGPIVVRADESAEVVLTDAIQFKEPEQGGTNDACQGATFKTYWTITGENQ